MTTNDMVSDFILLSPDRGRGGERGASGDVRNPLSSPLPRSGERNMKV